MKEPTMITIRAGEPDDYEAVHRILSGPRAMRNTLQVAYTSLEFWKKRLAAPADGFYGLVACAGAEVIGQLGLHTAPLRPRRRHAGQLGMAVRDDWQGKGAGTALLQAAIEMSDNWLNLTRLELEVFTDNAPAIRLYRKFGFEIEGTLREFGFRDGVYADAYTMARLKPRV